MRALSLSPESVLNGWVWQLVTMAGLHSGERITHLLFNCLFIWFFGRMVENRLTTRQFFGFCLVAAVVGSIFYVAWSLLTGNRAPALGASGFCMALTVLAAAWYPTTEILFFFVFRMQLWVVAAILVVMDLLGTLYDLGGVAYTVHLGGAAYGWLYYKYGHRIEGVFASVDAMADKAQRKKESKYRARDAELRKEVDRILDKVNREGMTALSDDEKTFLKEASRKLG
jgi:membrane associated rhomboid family serine protease